MKSRRLGSLFGLGLLGAPWLEVSPQSSSLSLLARSILLGGLAVLLFWLSKLLPYLLRRHAKTLAFVLGFFALLMLCVSVDVRTTTLANILAVGIPASVCYLVWLYWPRQKTGSVTSPRSTAQSIKRDVAEVPNAPRDGVPGVPSRRFRDVGGLESAKQQIRELLETRLDAKKYARHGVVKNGILLVGPTGTGKSLLIEAAAGEFGMRLFTVPPGSLVDSAVGRTAENIRATFERAATNVPALLFLDELDSMGSTRQPPLEGRDPGGGGRELNSGTDQLMACIDSYRSIPGFVYAGASNHSSALDPAVLRRWDLTIPFGKPDETAREQILAAHLSSKPWIRFDLKEFARETPQATGAVLARFVDQAALYAAKENRPIERDDLRRALSESRGQDRPLFDKVAWTDLVLDDRTEKALKTLIELLNNRELARNAKVPIPTGLLLVGPSGVGKSMIARLLTSETRRNYYLVTAADIVNELAKRIEQIFDRAKQSPSVIFLDELDSLMRYVGVRDQFLVDADALGPDNNVFLIGATNIPQDIDPAALRRLTDMLYVPAPDLTLCVRLLQKHLADVSLAPEVTVGDLGRVVCRHSAAEVVNLCNRAKRSAFSRRGESTDLPPLCMKDFDIGREPV